jgi:hypothetical protein
MSCPLTSSIFGLVGVVVGVFLGNWLAGVRDRAARKRAFIGFLEEWKAEITAPNRGPTQIGVRVDSSILAYDAKLGAFRNQVEKVRDVFSGSQRFETLANRLGSLKTKDWDNKNPRDIIVDVIERLTEFAA